jgi:serine/threonine protein kinase
MKYKLQKPPLFDKGNVRIYQDTTGTCIIKAFSKNNNNAFDKEKQILDALYVVIPEDKHHHFCFHIQKSNVHHPDRLQLIFPKYDMDLKTYLLNPPQPLDFNKMDSDISTALTIMHQYGFVHNDVKPENILVDLKNNRFVLADFGLTMRKNEIPRGTVGTPGYISPRMLKDSKVAPENDWWSYACLLVNALTVYCLDTPDETVEGYSVDFEPDEEKEMTCAHRDYLPLFQGTSDINTLFVTPNIADDLCNALQVLSNQTSKMQSAFIQEITQRLFKSRKADAPRCKDFTSCILENFQPNDISGRWNPNAPEWATHSNKWTLPANRYDDPVVQRLLHKALYIFLFFAKDQRCKQLIMKLKQ